MRYQRLSLVACDRLSPEEEARVERVLAQEPAWRATQDEARIARLMAQLEDPEVRVEAVLQREAAGHAAPLEHAQPWWDRATARCALQQALSLGTDLNRSRRKTPPGPAR